MSNAGPARRAAAVLALAALLPGCGGSRPRASYPAASQPVACVVTPRLDLLIWLQLDGALRDLRLLTEDRPEPSGCDLLVTIGHPGATVFSEDSMQAYSAYGGELLWEGARKGRIGRLGIGFLASELVEAFAPGQPAAERLAQDKRGAARLSARTVEERFGPLKSLSEADSNSIRYYGIRLGGARAAGTAPAAAVPVAARASEPPAAAPAPSRAKADVDHIPARRATRKGHAVVIGIERYRESLPAASYASADAETMAGYARAVLGYPDENVALLTGERATRGDFEKHFERWLPNRVQPDDEVFVYFSGHGAPNPKNGDAYLVPYDADPTYLAETGYPLKRLYAALANLPTKNVTVALDSCFSGAGGRSVIAKGARPLVTVQSPSAPAGLTVLAAASGEQISNTYLEKGHGLFTYFLLKGLQEKGGLGSAFELAQSAVPGAARILYNSDQTPQRWGGGL